MWKRARNGDPSRFVIAFVNSVRCALMISEVRVMIGSSITGRIAGRRIRPVLQTATSDCAPACLAMVADHFSVAGSLVEFRDELDPGRDGASVAAMRDTARGHGLQARAIRVDPAAVTG